MLTVVVELVRPTPLVRLAPCLWRPQRGLGRPSSATSPAAPGVALSRLMSTDADACRLLCKSPLAPASACQRCCRQGQLPQQQAAPSAASASWGQGGLFGTFGWQPPAAGNKPALGAPTVPLVPLSQLTAVVSQMFGVKPSWGADGNATPPAAAGLPVPNNAPAVVLLPGVSVAANGSAAQPTQPAQPVRPVQPVQAVQPAPGVQSTQPSQPSQPSQSTPQPATTVA
ncbi:hypothetical protein ONE63_006407 [Megalurothrips usitatus]|uniref:Uncharacterized protein n=1 Tax=Megalurothrips usitatus TaxID=439358 RepID=A0AAV7Y0P2_9NEOP|nr:hypothetical protein ONE63_006407 [Megalurothrips usitatus]